jgi:hypothetical protein
MGPLDNYDRGSWFIDDERPIIEDRKKKSLRFEDERPTTSENRQKSGNGRQHQKKLPSLGIKRFLLTCVEQVDHACIKYCFKGSPVDDEQFAARRANSSSANLQQLEPLNVHASTSDVHIFANKGGFYDGTFALDDEDLWDASTILTEIHIEDDKGLDIRELDVQPREGRPPKQRAAFQSRNDDPSWWNYTGKLPSPKLPSAKPRMSIDGRREVRL